MGNGSILSLLDLLVIHVFTEVVILGGLGTSIRTTLCTCTTTGPAAGTRTPRRPAPAKQAVEEAEDEPRHHEADQRPEQPRQHYLDR